MRQDQALTLLSLKNAGVRSNTYARVLTSGELREISDSAGKALVDASGPAVRAGSNADARDLIDVALALAGLLYDINALATANGIDLEPFVDHVHADRMREGTDYDQLHADATLMASTSALDQIGRLLDRDDLDSAEREQVKTCANLIAAGIPLRWPQRVAIARIEAVADARADRRALAAA